jgi:hypothetical protein
MTLEDHQENEVCGEKAENYDDRPDDVDLRFLDTYLREEDSNCDL